MNKNILKYVAKAMFVFLLASCSKERETITITEDDITVESQILEVDQLPKNAISAEKILIDNGITVNKKTGRNCSKIKKFGAESSVCI